MDFKFVNILILGFGFMFLFTSFQTMGNIEKIIIDSIKQDDNTFTGDGYTSLAIIYTIFSLCNWFAPSFISFSGPRGAMVIGALTYCFFMISFLWPKTWLLYLASCIVGAGAAIIWTGQGNFLSRCSEQTNISRNSGILWAMLQASLFFGNLFVYYQFQDKEHVDKATRDLVIGVLIGVAILGVIFLCSLQRIPQNFTDTELQEPETALSSAINAFKSAARLFVTRDMLLLNVTFFYTGIELSFFSGVYGASVGFTKQLGSSAKQIVGLCGICLGLGEVIGGGLFGILGSRTTRHGRDPIVIVGFIVHIISFFLIFVNLPNNAPQGETNDVSYINPPLAWVALLCAFMLGFGDSCYNTQIYSMLGGVYANNSVGAFALFKFTQSVGAAISFYYSSSIGLRVQLGILLVFATIGTACFCLVEWSIKRRLKTSSNESTDETSTNW